MLILVKTLPSLTSGLPCCLTVTAIGCNILAKYDCEEHVSHEVSNMIKLLFIPSLILSRVWWARAFLSALSLSASCQSGLYVLASQGLRRLVYPYSMGKRGGNGVEHAELPKHPRGSAVMSPAD